jgi:hypothetical protein
MKTKTLGFLIAAAAAFLLFSNFARAQMTLTFPAPTIGSAQDREILLRIGAHTPLTAPGVDDGLRASEAADGTRITTVRDSAGKYWWARYTHDGPFVPGDQVPITGSGSADDRDTAMTDIATCGFLLGTPQQWYPRGKAPDGKVLLH